MPGEVKQPTFEDILATPAERFHKAEKEEKQEKAEAEKPKKEEKVIEEIVEDEVEEDEQEEEIDEEVEEEDDTEEEEEEEDELSEVEALKETIAGFQEAMKSGMFGTATIEDEKVEEKTIEEEPEIEPHKITKGVIEFANEDMFEAIQDGDRDKFNEVLTSAVNSASQAVRENLLKDFNPLVKPLVQRQMEAERVWNNFYKTNPKLEEYHSFVVTAAQNLIVHKRNAGETPAIAAVLAEVADKFTGLVSTPTNSKKKKKKEKGTMKTRTTRKGGVTIRKKSDSGKPKTQAERQQEIIDYKKNGRLLG